MFLRGGFIQFQPIPSPGLRDLWPEKRIIHRTNRALMILYATADDSNKVLLAQLEHHLRQRDRLYRAYEILGPTLSVRLAKLVMDQYGEVSLTFSEILRSLCALAGPPPEERVAFVKIIRPPIDFKHNSISYGFIPKHPVVARYMIQHGWIPHEISRGAILDRSIAKMLVLIIAVTDDYLVSRLTAMQLVTGDRSHQRFFKIVASLPLTLQIMLASLTQGWRPQRIAFTDALMTYSLAYLDVFFESQN